MRKAFVSAGPVLAVTLALPALAPSTLAAETFGAATVGPRPAVVLPPATESDAIEILDAVVAIGQPYSAWRSPSREWELCQTWRARVPPSLVGQQVTMQLSQDPIVLNSNEGIGTGTSTRTVEVGPGGIVKGDSGCGQFPTLADALDFRRTWLTPGTLTVTGEGIPKPLQVRIPEWTVPAIVRFDKVKARRSGRQWTFTGRLRTMEGAPAAGVAIFATQFNFNNSISFVSGLPGNPRQHAKPSWTDARGRFTVTTSPTSRIQAPGLLGVTACPYWSQTPSRERPGPKFFDYIVRLAR